MKNVLFLFDDIYYEIRSLAYFFITIHEIIKGYTYEMCVSQGDFLFPSDLVGP